MMKKTLRGIALLLLIGVFVGSFAACRKDEGEYIPEGMQIANCEGDDFRLYVPTSWNLNNSYGVAGAYYNISVQSTVSVVKYPVTEEMKATLPEGGDATIPVTLHHAVEVALCLSMSNEINFRHNSTSKP